jgi:hypothetical protein
MNCKQLTESTNIAQVLCLRFKDVWSCPPRRVQLDDAEVKVGDAEAVAGVEAAFCFGAGGP